VPEIHLSGCGVNQDFAGNVLASTSSGWLVQIFKVYLRLALRGRLSKESSLLVHSLSLRSKLSV